MDDELKKGLEKIKDEEIAINSKTAKMLQLLSAKNLVYEQKLTASQLLVHPIKPLWLDDQQL